MAELVTYGRGGTPAAERPPAADPPPGSTPFEDPNLAQVGEPAHVLDVVAEDVPLVLHPGVRGELPVDPLHADADPAPVEPVRLEHPVERHRAHQAERTKEAVRRRTPDPERELPRGRVERCARGRYRHPASVRSIVACAGHGPRGRRADNRPGGRAVHEAPERPEP